MKAAVVDIKGSYAAVLAENGEVKKIVNNGYSIGDTIDLSEVKTVKRPGNISRIIRRTVAVAAAVIILAVGAMATAYAIPYGTVSVEGEPSIEYTINCFDYVIGVKALNESGEKILSEMNEDDLKHKKVDDAVAVTVERMKKDGYLDDENSGVSINADTGDDDHTNRLKEDLNSEVHSDMGVPEKSANDISQNENNSREEVNSRQENISGNENPQQELLPQEDDRADENGMQDQQIRESQQDVFQGQDDRGSDQISQEKQ